MTEESFQQTRKIMQRANYLRGVITVKKGNVAKWVAMEADAKAKMQDSKVEGFKKLTLKAIEFLNEAKKNFSDLKLPESDIKNIKKETVQCEGCGAQIAKGNTYCGECLCED